jgi:hypothetical protein
MNAFVQKHLSSVTGILSGFDRLVFRGNIKHLAYVDGMMSYLWRSQILLKDFFGHAEASTALIKDANAKLARKHNRPLIYLQSPKISKEEHAKAIIKKDGISRGLVCILTALEPCMSYDIYRNREIKKLQLVSRPRKCLHLYQYWIDPIFGLMNARIQSWFPFSIQICINGREWLSRQMDRAGLLYLRKDNCFTKINNVEKAQLLMEKQLQTDWCQELNRIAKRLNPAHGKIFGDFDAGYYWSTFQSEWATDVMFKNQAALDALYPSLVRHGLTTFQSPDVMRFLGKKLTLDGDIHGKFAGEIVSDVKDRHEGVRIKHRINGNSIKAYNKQGSILRVETTINEPHGFKIFRPKQDQDEQRQEWLPMRKGIADLYRRAEVSQAANDRYLEALSVVDANTPMSKLVKRITKATELNGKRVRPLRSHACAPWSEEDFTLLEAVIRGEFSINGFRNRDLRTLLLPQNQSQSKEEERKKSAKISRKLRMLRAHGVIKKVQATHRYQLTREGREIISALISARNANASKLSAIAA